MMFEGNKKYSYHTNYTYTTQIFNEVYDLGFHTPKKDKCTICTKAETFANEMTDTDKEKFKIHLKEEEAMYKRDSKLIKL